jgi:hypothetical protein
MMDQQEHETPAVTGASPNSSTGTSRVWRAMMLAPSVEVCEALLAGESVPADRLDPEWSKRLGLRP